MERLAFALSDTRGARRSGVVGLLNRRSAAVSAVGLFAGVFTLAMVHANQANAPLVLFVVPVALFAIFNGGTAAAIQSGRPARRSR